MIEFMRKPGTHLDKKTEHREVNRRLLHDNMTIGVPMAALTLGTGFTYFILNLGASGDERRMRACLILAIGSLLLLIAGILYIRKKIHHTTFGWIAFAIYIFSCTYYGMSRSLFTYWGGGNYMLDFIIIVIWCFGVFEIYPIVSVAYSATTFFAMYYLMRLIGIEDYSLTSWTLLFVVVTVVSLVRFFLAARNIYYSLEIEYRNRQLQYLSSRDGLTGLYNRFCLREKFEDYIGRKIIVAMMDIDDFKRYNDDYGHDFGDYILKLYSRTAEHDFKDADVFRYGGDEILIVSERDRESFEKEIKTFSTDIIRGFEGDGKKNTPTFSIGFVKGIAHEKMDLRLMLKQADENLYKVKHASKNSFEGSDFVLTNF